MKTWIWIAIVVAAVGLGYGICAFINKKDDESEKSTTSTDTPATK